MSTDGKMVVRLLGAKIAYFRTLAGLSQDELAVRIHSTQATISKIENGRYNDNLNIKLLFKASLSNSFCTFHFIKETGT